MGYKIYSPNEDHSCNYGVDFIFGAAFTEDEGVADELEARGYEVIEADALIEFDKLPAGTLRAFAAEFDVELDEGATKAEIVAVLLEERAELVADAANLTGLADDVRAVLDDSETTTYEGLSDAIAALIEPYESEGGEG